MRKALLILLCFLPALLFAQPYTFLHQPPANVWSTAGRTGGIPAQTQPIYTTINATGSDQTAAINTAIDNCPSGQVVKLGAGTFVIAGLLNIGWNDSGVVLRGSGVGSTILNLTGASTGSGIFVGTDNYPNFSLGADVITAGATQGSTTFTIASTANYSVGMLVELKIDNQQTNATIQAGAVPVISFSGGSGGVLTTKLRKQTFVVTAKTGTTITVDTPFCIDPGSLTCRLYYVSLTASNVGVEDMTVDGTNSTSFAPLYFMCASNCWASNVRVTQATNFNVYALDSCNLTLNRVQSDTLKGSGGPNGAGFLVEGTSHSLIWDSVVFQTVPFFEVNFGSTGNVIAYNYCFNCTTGGGVGPGIDTNHGAHNSYNLYEGNVAPMLQSDGFHGTSSEDTVFRNWFTSVSVGASSPRTPLILNRGTRHYQIVGNLLGTSGQSATTYSFGLPNMGNGSSTGTASPLSNDFWADWPNSFNSSSTADWNTRYQELDLDVDTTTTRKANYNTQDAAIPAGESLGGLTLPSSLWLASKPASFGSLAWPAYDSSSPNFSATAIPAGYRYINGSDPSGGGGDTTAPTPNPATISGTPTHSSSTITVTASTATDETSLGSAPYRFSSDNGSSWTAYQSSATYTFTSLTASTAYLVKVQYQDAAGNAGTASSATSVTTDAAPPPSGPKARIRRGASGF